MSRAITDDLSKGSDVMSVEEYSVRKINVIKLLRTPPKEMTYYMLPSINESVPPYLQVIFC